MDRIDAMRAFLAVADRGSFTQAAHALRLSGAATTRAVAQLESELGVALLMRTTRSVRLTERGAIYADRCRRLLSELEDAAALVRGKDAAPRGSLSITAPVLFGRLHILPIAERLAADHPDLSIRMTFLDRVTHLVEEGFDLAVRIGTPADSALIGVPLAEVRRLTVASPDYLAAHGTPRTPADLRHHRIVAFEGIGATNDWRFGARGETGVHVQPRLSVNSAAAAIASAERGHGITRALSYQVDDAIAAGRLARLLEAFEPAAVPVTLLYQASRRGAPNIAAFVAAARAHFGAARA
ncbi:MULTISPECIES: LysR family transcriptional regulator [unclassified Sphingomonas]|uniref:LysR family transcriptional regulator n=1 Tax=unclassified Sphingomonas TaxID=196159 RepID=UPI00082C5CAB|nr:MULTISPECIES: LysR family transcriptional regulator [unclassified Sphingomonas]MCH4893210.1 LysR family transcriptional regulator [Sphingomonas sp. SFZ2018-12]